MGLISEFYRWMWKRLPRRFSIPLLIFALIIFLVGFPWIVDRLTYAFNHAYDALPARVDCLLGSHWYTSLIVSTAQLISYPVFGLVMLICVLGGVLISYWLAVLVYYVLRGRKFTHLNIHVPKLPDGLVLNLPRAANPGLEGSPPSAPPTLTGSESSGAPGTAARVTAPDQMPGEDRLRRWQDIGIILAGGGAKGAYQAGAIKAVYEFLETNNAHHKVRMIAGSSIGSWNALFWLAHLIKEPGENQTGLLEQWWNLVDVKSVIRPVMYYPFFRNFFLSNDPWKDAFDALFKNNRAAYETLLYHIKNPAIPGRRRVPGAINFYFTRSNVARGQLEFTTNRTDLSQIPPNMKGPRPRPPVPRDTYDIASDVSDIRTAVFSSMDLPPLFPYTSIRDRYYEDGGVVDNLPIRFGAEIEKCDLLFVLPLNANFEEDVDLRSVVKRLFRVLNVRQGVLERNAFKMVYLYNELAALRLHAASHREALDELLKLIKDKQSPDELNLGQIRGIIEDGLSPQTQSAENNKNQSEVALANGESDMEAGKAVERASTRQHRMIQVFSICPAPKLAINTADFWKTNEAGQAFRLMYECTRNELDKFDFEADPDWVRMAQVSPLGSVTYLTDF